MRRHTAKCASYFYLQQIPELLAPRQLGYGVARGVEAAVHATHAYLNNLQQNVAIAKADFKNAFNSIQWGKMSPAVEVTIPELLPFVFAHSVCCGDSFLALG